MLFWHDIKKVIGIKHKEAIIEKNFHTGSDDNL